MRVALLGLLSLLLSEFELSSVSLGWAVETVPVLLCLRFPPPVITDDIASDADALVVIGVGAGIEAVIADVGIVGIATPSTEVALVVMPCMTLA